MSWVFYSNDELLTGEFFGYFSFIGEIWIYKLVISIAPVVCCMFVYWSCYYVWDIIVEVTDDGASVCYNVSIILFWLICASLAVILMCVVSFIALEVFCYTFLAFINYQVSTNRWSGFQSQSVSVAIKTIIDFIQNASSSNGKNDKILRILAINYALNAQEPTWCFKDTIYIQKVESDQGIKAL